MQAALRSTDRRVKAGKSVTPMFLIGVFFWAPVVRIAALRREEEKMSESQSLSIAAYEISSEQQRRIAIPRRFTVPMREMLALQPRFLTMNGRRAMKLLQHRRFRAAYDFMMLLSEAGQVSTDIATFWTDVQKQSEERRDESFKVEDNPPGRKRHRRKRKRHPSSGANQ